MNPIQKITAQAQSSGLNDIQTRLIIAQAQHETGNFTSALYLLQNNCFGMRPAQSRQAEQLNYKSSDNYAKYDSVEQSVRDLILWMNAKNFVWYDTPEAYCSELKNHDYFSDTLDNYSSDVSQFFYNG